jgi:HD-GYP domain-containing protein (c-di-GMP phosphodiesterase class II)
VCILSIKIGISLGYDTSRLHELGISAFLHDVGMTKYLELSRQERKLTVEESEKIKKHPIIGSELLKKAKDLPEIAIDVTLQQHERIDGSGYPYGLKGESLSTYAKIIQLADTYEAVTHSRSYRNKYEPFGAIKEILSSKASFDYDVTKAFINTVGLFPVGSMVRLNTGETGKVVSINREYPTRPVLQMLFNSENQKLNKKKIIDLLKQPLLYIKGCR